MVNLASAIIIGLFVGCCKSEAPIPEPVVRGEAPYHASVQAPFMGIPSAKYSGAVLDSRHILTIGNLYWEEGGELSILVGRTDLGNPLTGYRRSIKNITYHPDYFRISQRMGNQDFPPRNNLAILEVTVPLEFYEFVQPIKLPQKDQVFPVKEGRWTDWVFGGLEDGVLKKATLPILSKERCEGFYGKYKITDDMICVTYIEEATGESLEVMTGSNDGGVLVCKDEEGVDILCGLSSLTPILNHLDDGPTTANNSRFINGWPAYPTAFVDITKYVDWIRDTIQSP